MEELFTRSKIKVIIFSIILIVFGILFCVLPNSALSTLGIIVSIFLICWGLFLIIGYCLAPRELREPLSFFSGLVLFVVGVLIDFVSTIFVLLIGLIVLFNGVKQLIDALVARKNQQKFWYVDLVLAIIITILGLLVTIFCGTNIAKTIISILLGVGLILDGVCYLFLLFVLHREIKFINSIFKKGSVSDDSQIETKKEEDFDDFTDYSVDDKEDNKN